jgi:hypothetical protein
MDVAKVQEAIAQSETQAAYQDARADLERVWNQNRKALFAMVLKGNIAEGIDAVEEMVWMLDDAIDGFKTLREEAISLSYDIYRT